MTIVLASIGCLIVAVLFIFLFLELAGFVLWLIAIYGLVLFCAWSLVTMAQLLGWIR